MTGQENRIVIDDEWRTGMKRHPFLILHLLMGMAMVGGLAACGGDKTPATPPPKPIVSTLDLDMPEMAMMGKFEGPYNLGKMISPTQIELIDMKAKAEQFRLLGLHDGDYPTPTPTPTAAGEAGTPAPEPKPTESPEAIKLRQDQINAFKMAAIQKLCGNKELWILRKADPPPCPVYLFQPLTTQTDNQHLSGPAQFINAQALLEGTGSIDLQEADHPFYNIMLDCQLSAVIHSASTPGGETLWGKFKMKMPSGPHQRRQAELEKFMK